MPIFKHYWLKQAVHLANNHKISIKKKISLTDLRTAFRFHYDHTDHDPYLHENGKEHKNVVSFIRHRNLLQSTTKPASTRIEAGFIIFI